jgi:hemolysin III
MNGADGMYPDKIGLATYSKKEDRLNAVTHAAGVLLAAAVLAVTLSRSIALGKANMIISALVYGVSMMVLYAASAFYHGLPAGNLKKIARVLDYSMIFILIAGTATPCALISLYEKNPANCWFVFFVAWGCALAGILSTVFFFEKTKTLRMLMYIGEGVVMFASVYPIIDMINKRALGILILGGLIYVAGMIFLRMGRKRAYAHTVFHLFVLAGSVTHFYVMIKYIFI